MRWLTSTFFGVVVVTCFLLPTARGADPDPSYCAASGTCAGVANAVAAQATFAKKDNALFYIHVESANRTVSSGGTNTTKFKAPFFITVDAPYLAEVIESGNLLYGDQSAIVTLSVGNVVSPPKHYTAGTLFVDMWGATVGLLNGQIQAIDWDEGCSSCDGGAQSCIDNCCAADYSTLQGLTSTEINKATNLKVEVVWAGTDSGGSYLTSKGQLFSNFRKFSVTAGVATGAGIAKQTVTQGVDDAQTKTGF